MTKQRVARADLCRFLSACYYEPAREFAEERLFDSMADVAALVDPVLGEAAKALGDAFALSEPQDLLVDYTRLFLAGAEIVAKPYESVWRSDGSDVTSRLLALYDEGGFQVDEGFRDLTDHIAVELEFLYLLLYQDAPLALRTRLIREHLGAWVPAFSIAVRGGATTSFYRRLGELTAQVVAMEAARL